jgi:hypothetical protein
LQIKTKIVICHTADSKPVKQEVNGAVILPPLVFPGLGDNARDSGSGFTAFNYLASRVKTFYSEGP